jgi:hypothetical protein
METNRQLVERRLIANELVKLRERIRCNLDRSTHSAVRAKIMVEIEKLGHLSGTERPTGH